MAKGPIEFCGPLGAISQQLWAGYSEKTSKRNFTFEI
jgi:hypothetical protein